MTETELKGMFIKAATESGFKTALEAGSITSTLIAFILDTKKIWTQGTYFPCPYTKEEIDSMLSGTTDDLTALINEVNNKVTVLNGTGDGSVSKAVSTAKTELIGASTDTKDSSTITGAKKYADNVATNSAITITEAAGTGDILKTYTVVQGSTTIGTISLAKDLVVSSGSIVVGNWSGSTFTESASGTGKALKLTIANLTNPVYINVADLVDVYTAGDGIEISNTNVVAVKLDPDNESDYLTVDTNGLKLSGIDTISKRKAFSTISSLSGTIAASASEATLNIAGDTDITVTAPGDTVLVDHNDITRTDPAASNTTYTVPSDGSTVNLATIVTGVTSSTTGHVTAVSSLTPKIAHGSVTTTDTTGSALTPSFGGNFNVIATISKSNGHITDITTKNVTIPSSTATLTVDGLMSSEDKVKLDNIAWSILE